MQARLLHGNAFDQDRKHPGPAINQLGPHELAAAIAQIRGGVTWRNTVEHHCPVAALDSAEDDDTFVLKLFLGRNICINTMCYT